MNSDSNVLPVTAAVADVTANAVLPTVAVKPSKSKGKGKGKVKGKKGVKRAVGRPKAELKLILNKTFAMRDVVALNAGVNKLTVRKHILEGVKTGQFTKLAKTVTSGKKGKPAHLFINTRVLTANRANLSKTKATSAVESTAVAA
jgi:hypothetical protein